MGSSIEPIPTAAPDTEGEGVRESYPYGAQEEPDETAAYSLAWTDGEVTKTHIHDVDQLRSYMRQPKDNRRHFLVLHGLPVEYGVAIREVAGVDTSFIEAHSGRRSCKGKRGIFGTRAVYYEYPEFIHQTLAPHAGREGAAFTTITTKKPDLVGDAPTYAISTAGDGVMLCRGSLWLTGYAHILCLDRAAWEGPNARVSRGRRRTYTTETMPDKNGIATVYAQIDPSGKVTALGEEIQDFETLLYNDLRDGHCSNEWDNFLEFFEDLAIKKWDDFFDTLELDPSSFGASGSIMALFWQAAVCLERNLNSSQQWHKAHADHYKIKPMPSTEWEVLLSRLDRRVQFLSCLKPIMTPTATTNTTIQKPGKPTTGNNSNNHDHDEPRPQTQQSSRRRNNNKRCSEPSRPSPSSSTAAPDENQRSLNRVTYLGGVLLPFTVVSGILAIDTSFGPGEAQFWVFWAVSAPLALVTLAVIYADSIRKAEVWVEVAAKMDSDSDSDSNITTNTTTNNSGLEDHLQDPDVEQGIPIPLPPGSGNSTTRRFAVPVSFSLVDEALESVPLEEEEHTPENEDGDGDEGEPDMMVEKRWGNKITAATAAMDSDNTSKVARARRKSRRWRKEELGWMGAFATLAQLYKLKKGVPPAHLRRG